MNVNRFADAWRSVWSEGQLADPLPLPDSPAYPLARTVAMPEDHPYDTGAVSFRLAGVSIEGVSALDTSRSRIDTGGDTIRLDLGLGTLHIRGLYAIETKPDPVIDLDTGGDLSDLSEEASLAAGAAEPPPPPDPQKEAWLDQARDQRTRLSQTPNGQAALATYDQHNEVYDQAFRLFGPLRANWRDNGNTKDMAADTSAAIGANGVVNDPSKTYAKGGAAGTYNFKAFLQQLNIAVATAMLDPNVAKGLDPDPNSPFWGAAKAALAFGKGVNQNTGNAKANIQPMKAEEVYGTVDNHSGPPPSVSDGEASTIILGTPPPGGADAAELGWIQIDEHDRAHIENLRAAIFRQLAEDAKVTGVPLYQGTCEATLTGAAACVEISIDEHGAYRVATKIDLPAFDFTLADEQWRGALGALVRQRLEQMYFVRSLLHDAISDRLGGAVSSATAAAYRRTS